MEELITKIKAEIDGLLSEIDKTGNKSARARVRKHSVELSKLLKEYRKESLK